MISEIKKQMTHLLSKKKLLLKTQNVAFLLVKKMVSSKYLLVGKKVNFYAWKSCITTAPS